MNSKNTRRVFLRRCVTGITFMATGVLLKSCSNQESKNQEPVTGNTSSPAPCSDYTGLTETDVKARQSMGYVQQSPLSDRQCNNCNLWLPPPSGKPCGKCQLFKGPVEPGGHCTYWAPQIKQAV